MLNNFSHNKNNKCKQKNIILSYMDILIPFKEDCNTGASIKYHIFYI